ncbi:hypothetical protein [Halomonas halophila]|uniref:hypothetical protein n=1 Tax=Halomonas halophila TaxID=29573 RepID=UPI00362FEE10
MHGLGIHAILAVEETATHGDARSDLAAGGELHGLVAQVQIQAARLAVQGCQGQTEAAQPRHHRFHDHISSRQERFCTP